MNRFARIGLTVVALSLGVLLAGCEGFDPTTIMDSDFFNTKKRLSGERKPVFPEGTPGVTQGVPKELVKGYEPAERPQESKSQESQPTAQAQPAESEPKAEAKPKPKPKPKVVAKPKDESGPTAITIRPSQEQSQSQAQPQPQVQSQSQAQWPDPPPMQPPAASAWPGSTQPSGGVAWPDPPAPR
jgi:hypothetical protein